jgi:hypothetical protein
MYTLSKMRVIIVMLGAIQLINCRCTSTSPTPPVRGISYPDFFFGLKFHVILV